MNFEANGGLSAPPGSTSSAAAAGLSRGAAVAPSGSSVLLEVREGAGVRVLQASYSTVSLCGTIRDLLEMVGQEQASTHPIELHTIESGIMEMVLDYCSHLRDFPMTDEQKRIFVSPPPRDDMPWELSEWEQQFVTQGAPSVNLELMYTLILAANYLDLKPLLYLAAKAVANKLRGQSAQEIVRILGSDEVYTPETEASVRTEHPWIEDRVPFKLD